MDIRKLADDTAALMRTKRMRAPDAAREVLWKAGIRYEPDLKRLTSDITSELGRRGARAKAARARMGVKTPSIYKKPTQLKLKLSP